MSYDALIAEASSLQKLGSHADAADKLRQANALEPGRPDAWQALGESLVAMGQVDEGLEALHAAVSRDPERYETWYLLAFLAGREHPEQGIAVYRDLLARWPDDFKGWHNLGCLLRGAGRHDEALATFERAWALDPKSPALHFNLGQVHEALGRPERARTHYARSLELFPGFLPARAALERLSGSAR